MDSTVDLGGDRLLLALALVAPLVGWVLALRDLARRDDLTTGARVAWTVAVLVLALVGVVVYFLFRPRGATAAERAAQQQASDEFVRRHAQPRDGDDGTG